ncbi:MAG: M56 family metallopeptidase [Planctomycetaceae bacterium]
MNRYANAWLDFSENHPGVAFAVAISLHIAILITIGAAVACRMRRRSASACHLTWVGVAFAVLLVAPFRAIVPSLPIEVTEPLQMTQVRQQIGWDHDRRVAVPATTSAPVAVTTRSSDMGSSEATATHQRPQPPNYLGSAVGTEADIVANSSAPQAPAKRPTWPSIATTLLALYMTGVAIGVSRCALGWWRLRRYVRASKPLSAASDELVDRCARDIGLSHRTWCAASASVSVPLAFGICRRGILVPGDFESWDLRRQRDCLLHEMAHVSRRDCMWSLIGYLAATIYWFHPAVHFAAARLKQAREEATDDLVLRTGVESREYARSLLEVVARLHRPPSMPAVAMASSNQIEARLRRVLDQTVGRRSLTWGQSMAVWVIFVILASIGFRFSQAVAQTPPVAAVEQAKSKPVGVEPRGRTGDTFYSRMASVPLAEGDEAGTLLNVRGVIYDSDGNPAANAVVALCESSILRLSAAGLKTPRPLRPATEVEPPVKDVIARTVTAADGSYSFKDVRAPATPSRRTSRWEWHVISANEAGEFGWSTIRRPMMEIVEQVIAEKDVRLLKMTTLSAQAVSVDGQPVADAVVSVVAFNRPGTERWFERSESLSMQASSLRPAIRTDANGNFSIPEVPAGHAANIYVAHPDHQFPMVEIGLPSIAPPRTPSASTQMQSMNQAPAFIASPATITAEPTVAVRFSVRSESGTPLRDFLLHSGGLVLGSTDDDGRLVWTGTESLWRGQTQTKDNLELITVRAERSGASLLPAETTIPLDELLISKELNLVVEESIVVSGKVLCRDDQSPVPGVRVSANRISDKAPVYFGHSTTSSDGSFSFAAPKETVEIHIGGPLAGYDLPQMGSRRGDANDAFSRRVDLTDKTAMELPAFLVERVAPFTIRVIDAEGHPVAGATVTATHQVVQQRPPRLGQFASMPEELPLCSPVQTDKAGECALPIATKNWERGQVSCQKTIEGARRFGSGFIERGTPQPHTIKLENAWRISGKVTVDGVGVRNTELRLSRNQRLTGSPFGSLRSQWVETTTTDSQGEYEFFAAPNESYSVSVVKSPVDESPGVIGHPANLIAEGEFKVRDFEFFTKGGAGESADYVRDLDGHPLAGMSVTVQQYLEPRGNSSPLINRRTQAVTDEQGRFVLKELKPGKVRLHIYGPRIPNPPFVPTFAHVTVGEDNLEIRMDRNLIHPPERLRAERIVPADSVARPAR